MIARWSFYLDADVAGTFSCSTCTAAFQPFYNLAYNRTYTATMAWCVTDTAGNELGKDYSWSFTTGHPPEVIDCFPPDGAIEVPQDVVISATFSRPMDPVTITPLTFRLDNGMTGNVTYDGMTATFTPDDSLQYCRTYTAALFKAITDEDGYPLASTYTWSFTTIWLQIMPLDVGNRWVYRVEKFDTDGILIADYPDTVLIETTELIDGITWSVDNRANRYADSVTGLHKIGLFGQPYLLAKFPAEEGTGYIGDPAWEEMGLREYISVASCDWPVSVEAGDFHCYQYKSWIEDRFEYYNYYAPEVGLVMYELYQNYPMKSWPVLIERRSLTGYSIAAAENSGLSSLQ
jgi:hypothetical protein